LHSTGICANYSALMNKPRKFPFGKLNIIIPVVILILLLQVLGPAYGIAFGDGYDFNATAAARAGGASGTRVSIPSSGLDRFVEVTKLSDLPHPGLTGITSPGDFIENFNNSWESITLGLVYNPDTGFVRYAHESSPNPTIYDISLPVTHTVLVSISLSTVNSGWPVELDDRDGAGYDGVLKTYFLPDFNGDGGDHADDNIVEIAPDGTILNAWETDGPSNDSYDASAINYILDVAVVPGSPTRYFATALGDGSLMYELDLVKGGWFVPDSWGTISTCTVPGLSENMGIDYDQENGVLYHSDHDSATIVITDLDCNLLASFTCASPSGWNSGVTYIEGSSPPEVWVTDFESDSTTRCEAITHYPIYLPLVLRNLP
jgi:hypothetical protein